MALVNMGRGGDGFGFVATVPLRPGGDNDWSILDDESGQVFWNTGKYDEGVAYYMNHPAAPSSPPSTFQNNATQTLIDSASNTRDATNSSKTAAQLRALVATAQAGGAQASRMAAQAAAPSAMSPLAAQRYQLAAQWFTEAANTGHALIANYVAVANMGAQAALAEAQAAAPGGLGYWGGWYDPTKARAKAADARGAGAQWGGPDYGFPAVAQSYEQAAKLWDAVAAKEDAENQRRRDAEAAAYALATQHAEEEHQAEALAKAAQAFAAAAAAAAAKKTADELAAAAATALEQQQIAQQAAAAARASDQVETAAAFETAAGAYASQAATAQAELAAKALAAQTGGGAGDPGVNMLDDHGYVWPTVAPPPAPSPRISTGAKVAIAAGAAGAIWLVMRRR